MNPFVRILRPVVAVFCLGGVLGSGIGVAGADLASVPGELSRHWPKNRTVRFVFHGHSVPAGYFRTPEIRRFDSYPLIFYRGMCERFPTGLVDVSITAIGGESSPSGSARFGQDVLNLKPDVVFIDYALNDRGVGLEKAREAWVTMIESCRDNEIQVVLLTPTPDSREDILDKNTRLAGHADQIRQLGREFDVPVVDAYEAFRKEVEAGRDIDDFLSQFNHPNRTGHEVVAKLLLELFPAKPSD